MNKKVKLLFVVSLATVLSGPAFSQVESKEQKPATAKLQITQCALKVSGMTCGGCADMVKKRLLKLGGIKAATVDHKTGDVQVEYDTKQTNPKKIVEAFNKGSGGFKAELSKPEAKRE